MKKLLTFSLLVVLFIGCNKKSGGGGGTNPGGTLPPGDWQIACATHTSYILKPDHSLWASGSNTDGQFGNGTKTGSLVFVKVMDSVKAVTAGSSSLLVIKVDNSLWTAGADGFEDPITKTISFHQTPVKVMDNVVKVTASPRGFYLVLKADRTLWGWGRNHYGSLGGLPPGTTSTFTAISTPIKIWDNVTDVSAGYGHALFIAGGSLYGMGDNNFSAMGDEAGLIDFNHGPVNIKTPFSPDVVIAGGVTSFIKSKNGAGYGVGDNSDFRLGIQDTTKDIIINDFTLAPFILGTNTDMKIVPATSDWITYIISGTKLYACGYDFFGNNAVPLTYKVPHEIFSGAKDVAHAGHQGHVIVLGFNNEIWVSGANPSGELGTGDTKDLYQFTNIHFK